MILVAGDKVALYPGLLPPPPPPLLSRSYGKKARQLLHGCETIIAGVGRPGYKAIETKYTKAIHLCMLQVWIVASMVTYVHTYDIQVGHSAQHKLFRSLLDNY